MCCRFVSLIIFDEKWVYRSVSEHVNNSVNFLERNGTFDTVGGTFLSTKCFQKYAAESRGNKNKTWVKPITFLTVEKWTSESIVPCLKRFD